MDRDLWEIECGLCGRRGYAHDVGQAALFIAAHYRVGPPGAGLCPASTHLEQIVSVPLGYTVRLIPPMRQASSGEIEVRSSEDATRLLDSLLAAAHPERQERLL